MTKITPGESYGAIKVGADKDEIMSLLGMPEHIYPPRNSFDADIDNSIYWCYPSKGLDVEFATDGFGRVTSIHIFLSNAVGYKKLKVGLKSKAGARKKYGKPYVTSADFDIEDQHGRIIGGWDMWENGFHAFYDPNDNIMSITIFDIKYVNNLENLNEESEE